MNDLTNKINPILADGRGLRQHQNENNQLNEMIELVTKRFDKCNNKLIKLRTSRNKTIVSIMNRSK
jgi:hypothetical protein